MSLEPANLEVRLDTAEAEAIRRPRSAVVWGELGHLCLEAGRSVRAEQALSRAVDLAPAEPEYLYNLAIAQLRLGRFDAARTGLERVVRVRPRLAWAFAHLATAYWGLGRFDLQSEAIARASALAPDEAWFAFNHAVALLRLGRWQKGWEAYERRYAVFQQAPGRPTWDGVVAPGLTLVVAAEQGLGDTLQFVRYLPEARRRVGRLILAAQKPLVPFLSAQGLADEVVPLESMPAAASSLRLMSLPLVLGRPVPEPFDRPLTADPVRVEAWRTRLGTDRPIVAVAWQGSRTFQGDRLRSPPVTALRALLEGLEVTLVSVQKGEGPHPLADLGLDGPRLVESGEALDADAPFLDTAAVFALSDLVVTSDTAVAHLAGGMNVPTFLALPFASDWRWGMDGSSTPWYPNMRLFRQSAPGDWTSVYTAMKAAIIDSES